MDEVKILHIADVHIGRRYSTLSPKMAELRSSEVLLTLETALDRFCDADVALFSGDIFEADAPGESVDFVCRLLAKYPDIRFFVSCGNHDCCESSAIERFIENAPQNVTVFSDVPESIVLENLKTVIYGVSFAAPYSYTSLLSNFSCTDTDYIKIMIMHADISASSAYNPITRQEIADSGVDYLALGHIHRFSGILTAGNVSYAYPGVPEPGGFDETGECGVIYGTLSTQSNNLQFYPVSKREYRIIELDISGYTSQHQVISELKPMISSENLYRVVLRGSPQFGAPDTELYANALDSFYIEFADECRPSENILKYSKENSLRGRTARILEGKKSDCREEVFDKACEILTDLMCRG